MRNSDTKIQHDAADGEQAIFIPLIGNKELILTLGYQNSSAFRQALSRSQLPVNVFSLPNRRGKFALRADVLHWVASLKKLTF